MFRPGTPIVFLAAVIFLSGCMPSVATTAALELEADSAYLTTEQREAIADAITYHVREHFAHWAGVPGLDYDSLVAEYRSAALANPDRREFGLRTLAFFAALENGHTSFSDRWLMSEHGQPVGFYARPLGGSWVVKWSRNPAVPPGSVLESIDGVPMEEFAHEARRFIAASDRVSADNRLFHRAHLFPSAFVLSLAGGDTVEIDRRHQVLQVPSGTAQTTGRWLVDGQIAYIRIPGFSQPHFERRARELVAEYRAAPALIIDLRGNGGGSTPWQLTRTLMDRPYRWWSTEASTLPVSAAVRTAERIYVSLYRPPRYRGLLYLLVDSNCSSACEDFAMPFHDNGRAVLMGERTDGSTGQPVFLSFQNGMNVRVSARRLSFPDGSPFEGLGIMPHVEIIPAPEDVRTGRDVVLQHAINTAAARLEP
jgi:carboxyl-terminal processing protease